MLSRHLWLQRPVALQPMAGELYKKKKKKELNHLTLFQTLPAILEYYDSHWRYSNFQASFQVGLLFVNKIIGISGIS